MALLGRRCCGLAASQWRSGLPHRPIALGPNMKPGGLVRPRTQRQLVKGNSTFKAPHPGKKIFSKRILSSALILGLSVWHFSDVGIMQRRKLVGPLLFRSRCSL